MDLYYNQQKVSQLPVTGQYTIGQIKKILSDWLVPQGVTNYTIRLFFNNGTELSDVVFKTNTYDGTNLAQQDVLLAGGSIHVTPVVGQVISAEKEQPVQTEQPAQKVTKNKEKKQKQKEKKPKKQKKEKGRKFEESETLYLVKYNDEYKLFRTQPDAYEWLLTEILDTGVDLEELGLEEDEIDYDDGDVQNTIDEYIEENGDNEPPEAIELLE